MLHHTKLISLYKEFIKILVILCNFILWDNKIIFIQTLLVKTRIITIYYPCVGIIKFLYIFRTYRIVLAYIISETFNAHIIFNSYST